jgi:tetratricopeptide (TPR) repeat protein
LVTAWNDKGAALRDLGKNNEALNCLNEAIRLDQQLADAWSNKGGALMSLGRYDEALNASNEATRLDPNYAMAWNNKAVLSNRSVTL